MKGLTSQILDKALIVVIVLGLNVLTCIATCLVWQHLCVVHHAGLFESDSWGLTRFLWEDTACIHEQNQEGWKKIQDNLFIQHLEKLGIK